MSDKPILFSAPMVRALLAGTKTQTRRALNPQPYVNGFKFDAALGDILCHNDYLPPATLLMDKGKGANRYTISDAEDGHEAFGKYRVGDRLYVREAWTTGAHLDNVAPRDISPNQSVGYLADEHEGPWLGRKRIGMHMPRWASRITLTVTDIRVQRLQDISAEDAIAEGVELERYVPVSDSAGLHSSGEAEPTDPVEEYRDLWRSINGPGSWDENPWVVAYTFTVALGNVDQLARAA